MFSDESFPTFPIFVCIVYFAFLVQLVYYNSGISYITFLYLKSNSLSPTLKYSEITTTRPKPVEHGYVFSMAVGTIGESGGGIFKINILAFKHLIINIMAWVPRKINK